MPAWGLISVEHTTNLQPCDVLIRNGYVVTLDAARRIIDPGAVAIRGNSIVAVGPEAEVLALHRADRVLDADGGIVHPGLIDAHNHIVHGTARGIFGGTSGASTTISFADWKADVTPDDEFIATALAALEMLRAGFTTFVEPGTAFDTDAIAAAATAVGVRALLAAPYLWDQIEVMRYLGGLESQSLYRRAPPTRDRSLAELGRELHRNRDEAGQVHGYVSVYGLGTASDELLIAGKAMADSAGVIFQQHEGYTPAASRADRERIGGSRIRHLHEIGLLSSNSCLIHVYVLEDGDVDVIAESGTQIIICPTAYLELGISAEAPWRLPIFQDHGIAVALGTDGARNCTIGDAALGAFQISASIGHAVTPAAVLEMQTIDAARSAGMADRIGSIEVGKRADIVVRSAEAPELFPAANPMQQLALTARGGTVDTVIVNGEVVMRHGRATRVDERHMVARARELVRQRMARLGLSPARYWPS